MKELLQLVVDDPIKALTLAAIFLVAYFVRSDYQRRERQYGAWEERVGKKLVDTEAALKTHSEDMGKATKAINGDMLQIQREILSLKQDLLNRVESLREFASRLEAETKQLAHLLDHTVEKFEDRFGQVIQLKEELKAAHGKIMVLEESNKKFVVLAQRYNTRFAQIATALAEHQAAIKRAVDKGGQGEV